LLLPISVHRRTAGRHALPAAISLQIDYSRRPSSAQWVQGEAAGVRTTRSHGVRAGLVEADGTPVAPSAASSRSATVRRCRDRPNQSPPREPDPTNSLSAAIDAAVVSIRADDADVRRDLHQHPSLANREFRTAGIVAKHLESSASKCAQSAAHRRRRLAEGRAAGPVVALRADMDGLPVEERVDLPFASKARTQWNGRRGRVMHAWRHDAHVAILMAVASVLAGRASG